MAKKKSSSKCQTEVNRTIVPSAYYDVNKSRQGEAPKFLPTSRITSASNLKYDSTLNQKKNKKQKNKPFHIVSIMFISINRLKHKVYEISHTF